MRLHWLLPEIKGIPVLMYHRVWPGLSDGLTITPENLRAQWTWLKANGYKALSLSEFLDIANGKKEYTTGSVLLTFDDGYYNNKTYVYPLLKEFGWQATMFVIADTLDGTASDAANEPDEKLSVADLGAFDPAVIQLGLHGYHHEDFNKIGVKGISDVMQKSIQVFETAGLPFYKVLAYPYGARPKDKETSMEMKEWMQQNDIAAAFRIGNQVSKIPAPDKYEIRRIDIKGTDSLEDFKIKLKKGKLKPF